MSQEGCDMCSVCYMQQVLCMLLRAANNTCEGCAIEVTVDAGVGAALAQRRRV